MGLSPGSGQTKEYKIGVCCFSTKHAELRSKSKDWLAWKENNVSEWNDDYQWIVQWASIIKVQQSVLVNH